ncbi:hypothetical protein L596_027576 [Steinernema carpocapsae]|uniref:Uncharacterized protein n=1 Tax=Steinernema carpocapsae TaxID=34508 RepID=A0A4U5LVY1_STECR|nr:hypothetical protein L596_027576 [Steinernema carpocapsae]
MTMSSFLAALYLTLCIFLGFASVGSGVGIGEGVQPNPPTRIPIGNGVSVPTTLEPIVIPIGQGSPVPTTPEYWKEYCDWLYYKQKTVKPGPIPCWWATTLPPAVTLPTVNLPTKPASSCVQIKPGDNFWADWVRAILSGKLPCLGKIVYAFYY